MTYTYAILEVSRACFEEIKRKLREAGYENQFHEDGAVIDMHGIALKGLEWPPLPRPDRFTKKCLHGKTRAESCVKCGRNVLAGAGA